MSGREIEREAALLVVNTNFANAAGLEHPSEGSQEGKKSRVGLLRVKWTPSGANPETFSEVEKLAYKRGHRWERLRNVQHMLSGEYRVTKCHRTRIKPSIEVWRSSKAKRAFYAGLMVCGSVWSCPVCAAKITERRKIEIEQAPRINEFTKFMVTYTMQHNAGDRLRDLYRDLSEGLRDMKNSRGYKNMIAELQIVGTITGTEVTVSNANGWHPHKHALMFSRAEASQINAMEIQQELSELFITAMQKRGRYVHAKIGVDVRTENVLSSYVAKMGEGEKESRWTLAAEIAKSPTKTGRDEDHFHPFELIDMYASGNIEAGKFFKEYLIAMKSKTQLRYSKGLRALLGLGVEISDQEIAEHVEADAGLFALLSANDWKIINQQRRDVRGQILEVASSGNYSLFVAYMRALGCDDFGVEP